MSVKIMGLVWDADLPRNEKYILLAYADHADHEGRNIFPSVGLITWKTGYDERMVQRITRQLVKKSILVPTGRAGRGVNRYRINLTNLSKRPPFQSSQTCPVCNEPDQYLHRHHIVPKSYGGTNANENIARLCSSCHYTIHDEIDLKLQTIKTPSADVFLEVFKTTIAKIRGDILPPHKITGGILPIKNAQKVHARGGILPPKPSSNHPLTVMGASAENELNKFFEPKPIDETPLQPSTPSITERIQSKDPITLLGALGVTAQAQASPGITLLHENDWRINSQNIERAISDFLEATGLPIPAKPERGKWLRHVKEQLEEFKDLKTLYRKSWLEYKPQIDNGQVDITHPGALTVKMRAILQRQTIPVSQIQLTDSQQSRYQQLLAEEQNRNGAT